LGPWDCVQFNNRPKENTVIFLAVARSYEETRKEISKQTFATNVAENFRFQGILSERFVCFQGSSSEDIHAPIVGSVGSWFHSKQTDEIRGEMI
jgi:hypothetical protein